MLFQTWVLYLERKSEKPSTKNIAEYLYYYYYYYCCVLLLLLLLLLLYSRYQALVIIIIIIIFSQPRTGNIHYVHLQYFVDC